MQNNKFKDFRSFMKGKGYYIALLLCTAAVGVTGYFLLNEKESNEIPSAQDPKETVISAPNLTERPDPGKPAANIGSPENNAVANTTGPDPFVLALPVSGEVLTQAAIDHLAYNETTRDWRTHEGIDLTAALGDPVCAAADGRVYTIYEDEELGMTVVLHHTSGYSTHYSNLSQEIPVSVGDTLKKGDKLGTIGQTACVENGVEPHVHFALYENNSPLDPYDFLP
jgi:murein DD-endopeptidase MepM/ murein hydrolase activator NlpD